MIESETCARSPCKTQEMLLLLIFLIHLPPQPLASLPPLPLPSLLPLPLASLLPLPLPPPSTPQLSRTVDRIWARTGGPSLLARRDETGWGPKRNPPNLTKA